MLTLHTLKNTVLPVIQPTLKAFLNIIRLILNTYRQFPVAYTALSYLFFTVAFCYYPVNGHWLTGFMMMTLPVAMCLGLIACIYLLYKQQKMIAAAGLIWVLFSFVVVKRLVGMHAGELELSHVPTLNVLSFNSETFPLSTHAHFNATALTADIACFQEYSPNTQIEKQYTAKVEKLTTFDKNREIGLALLSKYPIVKQYGRIWNRANDPNINGFLCADIAYGADTIRVVNVHLWSMGVRTNLVLDALKAGHMGRFTFELLDTFRRLKEGFLHRSEQLQEVELYVAGCRYPVIICGDFNETPIGYSYGKLSQNFRNAFEEAGQGLGFTLNRQPYWARIDQQFVSADWHIKTCQTLSGIAFSDHFPVLAQYVLKKSVNTSVNVLAEHNPANRSAIDN
jgi:endonuclease/exonuclease/phosphatase family metal-dependent hydrolase